MTQDQGKVLQDRSSISNGWEMMKLSYLSCAFYQQFLEQGAGRCKDYLVALDHLPRLADEIHIHKGGCGLKGGKYGVEVNFMGMGPTPSYCDD